MSNQLQIICNCGRIAEVRRGKTGNKLAYTHCVSCKGSSRTVEGSKIILQNAKENIGKKGDFPAKEKVASGDWKPEQGETPEVLESTAENENNENTTESEQAPSGIANGLKLFVGLVVCSALGFTAYKVNQA